MTTYKPFQGPDSKIVLSKREAFMGFPHTFDYALPQDWLDDFATYCDKTPDINVTYHLILSSTVWAYPAIGKGASGPVTCCLEVSQAYERFVAWQS